MNIAALKAMNDAKLFEGLPLGLWARRIEEFRSSNVDKDFDQVDDKMTAIEVYQELNRKHGLKVKAGLETTVLGWQH